MPANNNEKWLNLSVSIFMPLFGIALTALVTWIWKVDDRQYELAGTMPQDYVSKKELNDTLTAATLNFEVKFQMLHDLIKERKEDRVKFENQLLGEMKSNSAAVHDLALKLEQRTKGKQ